MEHLSRIFRGIRRRSSSAEELLPPEVWQWLMEQHPILEGLSAPQLDSLRETAARFLQTKTFEAARGLEISEEMKAVIAVQAALPVLNLGLDWYRYWKSVVVVPTEFSRELQEVDRAGVVHEWVEESSGEAWEQGPVALSWQDVDASGWRDGYNVVIHEAAHRLDMLDGALNGRPVLHRGMSAGEWSEAFTAAFRDLEGRDESGEELEIDPYALENDSEFFAVLSEYFFERPRLLRREYPDAYRLLAAFYRQDPAARLPD
jgi:hypothetical protein